MENPTLNCLSLKCKFFGATHPSKNDPPSSENKTETNLQAPARKKKKHKQAGFFTTSRTRSHAASVALSLYCVLQTINDVVNEQLVATKLCMCW
jgi:hypothetical protein